MPLAPEMAAFLAGRAAGADSAPPAGTPADVENARVQHEQDSADFTPLPDRDAVAHVEDLTVPGPEGQLSARRYHPGQPVRATLVWLHGGGWVTGSLATGDIIARALCARAGLVVVSIDYRRAPESPWPIPYLDCLAATEWVLGHLHDIDATGPVLVGGDSSGGNLAGAVALELGTPRLAGQVLLYPVIVLDRGVEAFQSRVDNASGYYVGWGDIERAITQYTPNPDSRSDPRATLSRSRHLSTAPPALIATAEYDTLRDEGDGYAQLLADAGVPTRLLRFDGLVHGCFDMIGMSPTADRALDATADALRDLIAGSSTG